MTPHIPPSETELQNYSERISGPSRQGLTKPEQGRLITEIRRLRALCGRAVKMLDAQLPSGVVIINENLRGELRAASEGRK